MSLANLIKRLQDVMRKDPGVDGDVQRLNQFVWLIFLKVFDYKEEENELSDDYKPVIPEGYRWRDWANPLTEDGKKDVKNQLTGPELIDFVDNKLLKVLKGDAIDVDGKLTVVFDSTDERALLVKQVMADAANLMKNGYFLREVLNLFNEVDLAETYDSHEFSEMYEGLLDGLQAMGKYGEFHTVKAITRFGVDHVHPKLGETVADWACGTSGFLVDALDTLESQIRLGHNEDREIWQKSVRGGEFKPMPFRLSITNLLLHGVDVPNIRYGDSLDIKNFSEYYGDDLVDVCCLNPPYGGVASEFDKLAFPADMRSSETADLFVALAVKRLKKNGRAIIVVPDGFIENTDSSAQAQIRKYLLENANLHTVIRLPRSCFAPYTSIATNLLFFDKTGPTSETWFYRLDMPEGYKHFSKTKPMKREHFAPCDEWWDNRVELRDVNDDGTYADTWKAKKISISEIEKEYYTFSYCGYPNETKIILSPEETLANYNTKRMEIEEKLKDGANSLKTFLSNGSQLKEFSFSKLTKELVELNENFPKEMKDSLLQAAISGKLTEQSANDSDVFALASEISVKDKKWKPINDDELPFSIPDNWVWMRLREFAEISAGGTPSRSEPKYWNGDIPWVKIGNMGSKYISAVDEYITEEGVKNSSAKWVEKGTILYSIFASIGTVGILDIDATTNQAIAAVKVNNQINRDYMYYVLVALKSVLVEQGHGMAQMNINQEILKNTPIPIPPIEEQQRIVEKLDSLMLVCE